MIVLLVVVLLKNMIDTVNMCGSDDSGHGGCVSDDRGDGVCVIDKYYSYNKYMW